jgi:L1 cell adhesion molecule like protein
MSTEYIPAAIDLATTYSAIAIFRNGHPEIVPVDGNERSLPSVVCFTEDESFPLIGRSAKDEINGQKLYDSKRLIGRRYDDPAIQSDFKNWPFKIINDQERPKYQITINNKIKTFAPEEISAMILSKLKEYAESYSGKKVKDVVITVPSYFNDQQRSSTKDAAHIAGLNVLRMINEPTAAAMAYGMDKLTESEKTLLIADVGGGTSDFTVLVLDDGVFEVKSTYGDSHLGGQDLDNAIFDFIVDQFRVKEKTDLRPLIDRKDPSVLRAINKMKKEAERIKILLSSVQQATISIENLYDGKDMRSSITRAMFEERNKTFFEKCLKCIEQAVVDAEKSKNQIDEIILVGGTTRIPKFQESVSRFFNGKNLCKSINPDEAIALGAAIQAGVLMKDESAPKDILLIDVCPLSLGVAVAVGRPMFGGRPQLKMEPIIPRNTTIPTSKEHSFTTSGSGQDQALIEIYEGERARAEDNKKLGEFMISGLQNSTEKVMDGVAKINIQFNLDSDGVLSVTAKSGSITKKIEIKDRTRYSSEEIEEMIQRAQEYREQDEQFNRRANEVNILQGMISQLPEDQQKNYQEWMLNAMDHSVEEIQEKQKEVQLLLQNNPQTNDTSENPAESSKEPIITEVD